MQIKELAINHRITSLLENNGISELFPPQIMAFETGVLNGKNLVLAVPTSAGKTLVAEICMMKAILEGRGKALYLVPLRSLAREKYADFRKYDSLGIRTAMSVGDYDSPGVRIREADIIVLTTERADSLVRHKVEWLNETGVIVVDEIHLVNDPKRGPTLEMVLAKLLKAIPNVQIVALSATISNAEDIAGWLAAELVISDWRPIPLAEGVFLDDQISFSSGKRKIIQRKRKEDSADIVCDILDEGGQALVFVSNRKSTVAVARRLAPSVKPYLKQDTQERLAAIAKRIARKPSAPEASKNLGRLMMSGVAFHHAGLDNTERAFVEDSFKQNLLKVVVATPTLAAGINLPARRVLIRDYRRFEQGRGSLPIPILEYKQMAGRAGRPKYDQYGEAILIARSEQEQNFLTERYLLSDPEMITSKLASPEAVRFHVLSSIATEMTQTRSEIDDLVGKTFFSYQFEREEIDFHISSALSYLEEGELIQTDNDKSYKATLLGKRTSRLYIDPSTTILFRDALTGTKSISQLGMLHLICHSIDQPTTYVSRAEIEDYEFFVDDHISDFLVDFPDSWELSENYAEFLSEVKTARLLIYWISEKSEIDMTEDFGVGMGDIHRYVQSAEWLTYAASEIAKTMNVKHHLADLHTLYLQMKYGVKEDILDLVGLRGIGRVRGRMLSSHGLKTVADLYHVAVEELARIPTIGTSVAESVKRQLGIEIKLQDQETEDNEYVDDSLDSIQTLLEDFEPKDF
ncbi:MAG: DEAD/DEAH box helicase [Candidatus Thorarchaeota archaeon]|nr:DEAD/DEAH box helicase [Candidatus Thorarchaeota archaeon]